MGACMGSSASNIRAEGRSNNTGGLLEVRASAPRPRMQWAAGRARGPALGSTDAQRTWLLPPPPPLPDTPTVLRRDAVAGPAAARALLLLLPPPPPLPLPPYPLPLVSRRLAVLARVLALVPAADAAAAALAASRAFILACSSRFLLRISAYSRSLMAGGSSGVCVVGGWMGEWRLCGVAMCRWRTAVAARRRPARSSPLRRRCWAHFARRAGCTRRLCPTAARPAHR